MLVVRLKIVVLGLVRVGIDGGGSRTLEFTVKPSGGVVGLT